MKLTFLDPSGERVTIETPITLSATPECLRSLRDLIDAALRGHEAALRVIVAKARASTAAEDGVAIDNAVLGGQTGNEPDRRVAPVALQTIDPSDPSTWDYDPEAIALKQAEVEILRAIHAEPTPCAWARFFSMRPPLVSDTADGRAQLTPAGALVLDRILAREKSTLDAAN